MVKDLNKVRTTRGRFQNAFNKRDQETACKYFRELLLLEGVNLVSQETDIPSEQLYRQSREGKYHNFLNWLKLMRYFKFKVVFVASDPEDTRVVRCVEGINKHLETQNNTLLLGSLSSLFLDYLALYPKSHKKISSMFYRQFVSGNHQNPGLTKLILALDMYKVKIRVLGA